MVIYAGTVYERCPVFSKIMPLFHGNTALFKTNQQQKVRVRNYRSYSNHFPPCLLRFSHLVSTDLQISVQSYVLPMVKQILGQIFRLLKRCIWDLCSGILLSVTWCAEHFEVSMQAWNIWQQTSSDRAEHNIPEEWRFWLL